MNRDNSAKNSLISILRGQNRYKSAKMIVGMLFMLLFLLSCSNSVFSSKVLPEEIKYDKVNFEPCAYSGSDYVCMKNSDAVKLVINFKNCQEQNITLREINGN